MIPLFLVVGNERESFLFLNQGSYSPGKPEKIGNVTENDNYSKCQGKQFLFKTWKIQGLFYFFCTLNLP